MNMIYTAVAVVVVAALGYMAYVGGTKPAEEMMMKDAMTPEESRQGNMEARGQDDGMGETTEGSVAADSMKDEVMMDKTDASVSSGIMKKGTIEAYSPEKLALAQHGKVALFFHAPWCPICRSLDAQAAADPDLVPAGVHVLKVDYDTALELRKKYGVTVQHTFVQVDASGNALGKWSDATTYTQLFARLK